MKRMSLHNKVLPVWYCKCLKHVRKDHCLYNICYLLRPGEEAYVVIGDARYKCSRHKQAIWKYCKEYDKNVRYRQFDLKKNVWKCYGNPVDYFENDWIIPFTIRLIDKCTNNRHCYGYGDGKIRVYHWHEKKKKRTIVHVDQQKITSKKRKHNIKLYGSENFMEVV